MILATIYGITHPSRPLDAYIGQTIDLSKRTRQHRRSAIDSNLPLYRWWRKRVRETGEEPITTVLFSRLFWTREEAKAWLDAIEIAAIAWVRDQTSARCLNCTAGGEGTLDPSPATRAKMSASAKARPKPSAETRERMSASLRAAFADPAVRAHRSAVLKGRPKSPEHVAKVAAALRGYTHSAETRARMSAGKRGSKQRPETIERRAAALRGRVQGPEERAIRRESARARGARVTHCPAGHPYDDTNPKHRSGCRECKRAHGREYQRARRRAQKEASHGSDLGE